MENYKPATEEEMKEACDRFEKKWCGCDTSGVEVEEFLF